jgi:uncharacterized membrane protein
MQVEPEGRGPQERTNVSARTRLLGSAFAAVAVSVPTAVLGADRIAALVGWDVLALVFCGWVWIEVWRFDAPSTASHALRVDPGRELADLLLLGAAVASLVAVGLVLFSAGHANGSAKYLEAGFALLSVFVSWTLVHTVFTLRYAHLYYSDPIGGVDFNEKRAGDSTAQQNARYSDFAYLAFTIGMTFQVSDTDIEQRAIRRAVLHQALLSYPLGTVIIAAAINLVSGLAK